MSEISTLSNSFLNNVYILFFFLVRYFSCLQALNKHYTYTITLELQEQGGFVKSSICR